MSTAMEVVKNAVSEFSDVVADLWPENVLGKLTVAKGLGIAIVSIGTFNFIKEKFFSDPLAPPRVPHMIPIFGHAADFGSRPIDFLLDCYDKFGPVFTFTMFGSEVTFCLGSEASSKFWGAHNDILNAEDLYANITVPVFGEGVAYDVEHKIFSEQKQMAKEALTLKRFEKYTSIIESETNEYIKQWEDGSVIGFFEEMAGMIILTATHCLHGREVRNNFDASTAELYADLDGGFTPLGWFFPRWFPFPSFLRRDRAHLEMKKRFRRVIDERRANDAVKKGRTDMMETFMTVPYKKVLNQRTMNDSEVSGMLIALLMAGQHSSSTVSSWLMSFVCSVDGLQEKLYEEQVAAFKELPGNFTIEHLELMPLLHACLRETLRLRPPIMSIMRKAREDFTVTANGKKYVIKKGSQVCVSPTLNGRLPSEWDEPLRFDPNRFLMEENGRLVVTQAEQLKKGGKFKWVPFGAGRHRCIGFEFAQLQIRCVISTIIRQYKLTLESGHLPAINYKTMIHTPLGTDMRVEKRK
jgi:sterol 14-demethylase